jgi:hypothetical protein
MLDKLFTFCQEMIKRIKLEEKYKNDFIQSMFYSLTIFIVLTSPVTVVNLIK